MKYYYPAIFCPSGDGIEGYEIIVPDIPGCFSCGDNINECMWMVQDAIGLMLEDVDEKDYPRPTPILDVDLSDCPEGSFVSYVCFDKEFFDAYTKANDEAAKAADNNLAKTAG